MPRDELSGPDLDGVIADANAVGLPYVVIGGFSVIAHGYVRATRDSDLLVPDGAEADQAIHRFLERVDAARLSDGRRLAPGDIVGTDHLRGQDRLDLENLERVNGELPIDPIPGLDAV